MKKSCHFIPKEKLPRAALLKRVGDVMVWIDFIHRCRTKSGLEEYLWREIRAGRAERFRLFNVESEGRIL